MTETPKITRARIEVARTRASLLETARDLQARLQPGTLAGEVWEKAKDKGADLAEGAVDAVAKRPLAVGGVAAAIALFLAREPLKAATVKFYDTMMPLFEPRKRQVALKDKKATTRRRAPRKKRADAAQEKTEKA